MNVLIVVVTIAQIFREGLNVSVGKATITLLLLTHALVSQLPCIYSLLQKHYGWIQHHVHVHTQHVRNCTMQHDKTLIFSTPQLLHFY